METLSISSTEPFSLELIQRAIARDWQVEASEANTLVVHGPGSRAYLHLHPTESSSGTHSLLLDYSDVELAKTLLERIADDPALTVDNDFGTVLPGNQFVARIKSERGWNWRT
jgi:hypothetical protein